MTAKKNKIKPVIRYVGSKYRKLDKFIPLFNLSKNDTFVDVFGGSGIVGVNVKNAIDCKVIINDFDNILPLTKEYVELNLCSFNGNCKYKTEQAIQYFHRRERLGIWNKVEIYNSVLANCKITHIDYKNLDFNNCFLFLDPPYFTKNAKTIYKSIIDFKEFVDWVKKQAKKNKIFMTINDSPKIREAFKEFNISQETYDYCSIATHHKKINELIIRSY